MGGGSENGLRVAAAFGAEAVLHVPGGVGNVPMPEPWEYDIEFDDVNGHLTRVVKGDNEKFKAYIEAHNRSMDSAREHVKKLIPVAEETKVVIALENVWNNFCVKPAIFKWMVASFKSPWVKAYFDVGNHVKYITPPEVWIREFGPLLAKVHIKDFKLNPDNHGGKFVHPRDGSVNWPAVRQALDDAGYNGWLVIEDGGLPYPEFGKRLDQIIAGQ
jgi:L-ribulose-5-phosphate 3-epimerase